MLGVLRDEVVPEVLGGRPAEPQDPSAPDPQREPVADGGTEAEGTGGSSSVSDTGDVTPTPTATDAPALDPTEDAPEAQPGSPADDTRLDEVCAAAVDLARAAATEEAGSAVGEHLGAEPDEGGTVTHSFATTDPAYRGWRWAVTVARAAGTDVVTVDEVVLLPGAGALLAPAWVPYSDRVQPDDLGAGDLLPPHPDDPRLVPSYADTDDDQALRDELLWELGLGRPRVLSADGRRDAAERWQEGDTGPASPRAQAAPGSCGDCGFLVPLGGSLRAAFGVCANAQAPDDARVVSLRHGCGAHSEIPADVSRLPVAELVVDEVEFEFEERPDAEQAAPASVDPLPDPVEEGQAEELGHS